MAWKIRKNKDELPELEDEEEIKPKTKEIPSNKQYKQSISTPERIQVVNQLPTQQIRKYKDENGNLIRFVTIEEALTELMNNLE